MDSASSLKEIELKFSSDLPFSFDNEQNSEDIANTYYLELEGEIDLGLKEDTDYVLIKTEDNEFKFCEVEANENNVDFHLHSPKSKIAINDSNATRLLTDESQKKMEFEQESDNILSSESEVLCPKDISSLSDALVRPNGGRIDIMYEVPNIDPGPFSSLEQIKPLNQGNVLMKKQTQRDLPTSHIFQNISGSQVQSQTQPNIQTINHLYGDLNLQCFPSRKRGRPRKYSPLMPPIRNIPSLSSKFNIQRKDNFENTRTPFRSLENIPNKFYPMDNFENGCELSNYREYQKMQDKNRRQRIKAACQTFRTFVPGITRRTDSTSVWEQSVRYIAFIKQRIGDKYDREFLAWV